MVGKFVWLEGVACGCGLDWIGWDQLPEHQPDCIWVHADHLGAALGAEGLETVGLIAAQVKGHCHYTLLKLQSGKGQGANHTSCTLQ